jgi:ribonuclease HII
MVPEDMNPLPGVDDSKKLSPRRRTELEGVLTSLEHALVFIDAAAIDQEGMAVCLRRAFQQAVDTLWKKGLPVSQIRIDGAPQRLNFQAPTEFIVKGDALDWRIGAASILAKVARDRLMVGAAKKYPAYGWESNMGYGSREHQEAIRRYGLTPLHRATFCRNFIEQEEDILDLWGKVSAP